VAVTSRPTHPTADRPTDGPGAPAVAVARRICPYLSAEDGGWRSPTAERDQHCAALEPPAPLAIEKQRRLCLTQEHRTCATFRAAAGARDGDPARPGATRWTLVRTAPVVLDGGRVSSATSFARRRSGPQLALGGLMVLALAAIVIARLPEAGATPAGAVSSPSPRTLASASPTPRPTPRPTPSATPEPTASPRPSVTPSPAPTVLTYRVIAGDTLYAIAIRYGTTVKAIYDLNELTSTNLRIGQVLKIP
jgi:hypothetical protein